ncbi:MAG: hypothetical protein Unbinned273contig1001_74 [Prokaryotic dsDNA virus sp.]|nr:MAG: hypothetical protein Unbinned273contig1001_74 [Prokaryotic dsDNA virus sp.]|tara:strand:+ start:34307 stop:35014 length:708 start_codon:yes stop_codon:yes gene_type:complete
MGIFSRSETADTINRSDEKSEWARAQEYSKTLDEMAREEDVKLRERVPDLTLEYEAEHASQVEGFNYRFQRHGDFLTVSLTRAANDSAWYGPKHVETFNLGKTNSIRFTEGKAPAYLGGFGWIVFTEYETGGTGQSSASPTTPPRDGKHVLRPARHPGAPGGRVMLCKEEGKPRNFISMGGGVNYRTTDFPMPSEDDAIRFDGIGLTIYAPFGLGEKMHADLLAEIGRGWEASHD